MLAMQRADAMTPTHPAPRYAVYFAPPPDSVWWRVGSAWLGRCAASGQTLTQPGIPGVAAADLAQLTAPAARYGWHATLKAPFTLADGLDLSAATQRVQALCSRLTAFTLPALSVVRLGNFLALVPVADCPALQGVADACVTELHSLAAPLPASELARRRGAGLSARQEALLQAWGYPHVLDQFRFHFSLTGPLNNVSATVCDALVAAAKAQFDGLPPCRFDVISLFEERTPGAPMRLMVRWPLRHAEEAA
jgi:putative phosphonate metabolism protein